MKRSANEVTQLAERAGRGAGMPLARAERFGRAVARHLAEGRDEIEILEVLSGPRSDAMKRVEAQVLRATCGGPKARRLPSERAIPGLQRSILETLKGFRLADYGDALELLPDPGAGPPPLPPRLELSGRLLDALQDFARRTHVPASEDSRQSGAGAGNIDND